MRSGMDDPQTEPGSEQLDAPADRLAAESQFDSTPEGLLRIGAWSAR